MPPSEITVTCPGCGYVTRMPTAAIRRDNTYCSRCGKQIPLDNVQLPTYDGTAGPAKRKPRRPAYRPTRKR